MTAQTVDLSFAERAAPPGFDAAACMACGVCTAICPMGIDVLPRTLFRYVTLGLEDEVRAHADAVYQCLLCKLCEDNCTGGVHIVDNVRSLRSYFNREVFGLESRRPHPQRQEVADAAHP